MGERHCRDSFILRTFGKHTTRSRLGGLGISEAVTWGRVDIGVAGCTGPPRMFVHFHRLLVVSHDAVTSLAQAELGQASSLDDPPVPSA